MKNFLSRLAGTAFVVLGVALQNSRGCSADERQITLVALGDGFLTGDGITPGKELPVLLEATLIARGRVVKMQNIFSETSAGGAKWMMRQKGRDFLTQPGGRAVIVEFGPYDCHGIDPAHTRANLDQILAKFAEKQIPVLVIGVKAPSNCSASYDRATYDRMFPELAAKYSGLVYASFLDGVSEHPELFQTGMVEPNDEGVAMIAERILPTVETVVKRAEQQ